MTLFLSMLVLLLALNECSAFNVCSSVKGRCAIHSMRVIQSSVFSSVGEHFSRSPGANLGQPKPTLYEINRRYAINPTLEAKILDESARGHLGVVFNLETAMVNLGQTMGYSFAIMAGELGYATPSPTQIYGLVGCSVKDAVSSLGWTVSDDQLFVFEKKLFAIVNSMLDKLPITARVGAAELIKQLLSEGNDIVVTSSLPRETAKKIMGKTGLASLFEAKIPGDHFICKELPTTPTEAISHVSDYGERYWSRMWAQSCEVMRKPPLLCTGVDGNHRSIVSAKRNGFTSVAISGLAPNAQLLRPADLIVPDLRAVNVRELYKLTARAVRNSAGPAQQPSVVPELPKTRTIQVSAPSVSRPRPSDVDPNAETGPAVRQPPPGAARSWRDKRRQRHGRTIPYEDEESLDQ